MISEELLKQAAEEAEQVMLDSLPAEETEITFSPEFEQKMRSLCRRAEQPRVYTFVKRAACAVLALFLLCGVLMLHPEAHASIAIWVRESFAGVDSYNATGDFLVLEGSVYRVKLIPNGYKLCGEQLSGGSHNWTYIDDDGELLHFVYILDPSSANLHVIKGDCKHKTVSVKGYPADVYISQSEGYYNTIVWSNSDGVLFCLTGAFDVDELIHMAESVYSTKK